jgi:hypothetical protein
MTLQRQVVESSLVLSRFRAGFYGGLILALFVGVFLIWLWQPERQVERHTENFLHAIEQKNWSRAADFIGNDYQDQWGDDRARVVERAREFFRYLRGFRLSFSTATVNIDHRRATWIGKITIEGGQDEVMAEVKERVNSLTKPFELEWRRISAKPWNWKLARVGNPDLEIPAGFE